jgi:pSer/pThr/pTyr-binding forkhead associated (FHA) protein
MTLILQNVSAISELPDIVIKDYPFVIGRGGDSHAKLPLAFISRRHCQMTKAPEGIHVQDLESHNGTYVNGRKAISPLLVQNGDEISLGSACFRAVISNSMQDTSESIPGLTVDDVELPAAEEARFASPTQR